MPRTLNLTGFQAGDSLSLSVSQGGLTAGPITAPSWGQSGEIIVDDAASVAGGRVTVLSAPSAGTVDEISITDGPAHGFVTVNPDNTMALVLSGSDYSGALSFDYQVTRTGGAVESRRAALTVAEPVQQSGWGQGKHYMLEVDAQGDLVVEHGENHRKVYISGSAEALTRADIATLESVTEATVTAAWLRDSHPEYGSIEALALAPDIGMELWYAMHPFTTDPPPSSNWLLFERGYTYADTNGLFVRGYSGESPLHPIYLSAWGTGAKPKIVDQIRLFGDESKHVVIDDIEAGGGVQNLWGKNFLTNNITINGSISGFNIQNVDGFTLRDSVVAHVAAEGSGHSQGLFADKSSSLLMEGNVFHHNGWQDGYLPDASGPNRAPSAFSHNVYIQNDTFDVTFRDNITSQGSSIGVMLRGGGFVEDNAIIDNNAAMNVLGGIYQDDGPIGNFSFVADNVITSAGYKTWTYSAQGAVSRGLDNIGFDTTLLDNIIAHLADPDNPAELVAKPFADPALTSINTPFYDDTIIYNWVGGNGGGTANNTPGLNTTLADQTTIQRFAATELSQGTATITELMDAIVDGSITVTADDIVAYFQNGFGITASGDGSATSHRFIPNEIADGIRWDNRINWDSEEVPDAGDSVNLAGNRVQFNATTTINALELGGGALSVNGGRLTVSGSLTSAGATGRIETYNAGQIWIGGYAGAQTLEVSLSGGRFVSDGTTSAIDLTVTKGEVVLLEGAAMTAPNIVLTQSAMDRGSAIRFDGDSGGAASLTLQNLTMNGDGTSMPQIVDARSGIYSGAANVASTVDITDLTLTLDCTGLSAGDYILIDVDTLTGSAPTGANVTISNGLGGDSVAKVGNALVLTVAA